MLVQTVTCSAAAGPASSATKSAAARSAAPIPVEAAASFSPLCLQNGMQLPQEQCGFGIRGA